MKNCQNDFLKWKCLCEIHAKSLMEMFPEIASMIKNYSLKNLYEMSNSLTFSEEQLKTQITLFIKSQSLTNKKNEVQEIASNFNVDQYCIYDDFTSMIEKVFEAAEDHFNNKILKEDYSSASETIAAYKLIVDMVELIILWKEIDNELRKFQKFCKYRVIRIYEIAHPTNDQNNASDNKQDEIQEELNDLINQVETEKKEEITRRKTMDNPFEKTEEVCIDESKGTVKDDFHLQYNQSINIDVTKVQNVNLRSSMNIPQPIGKDKETVIERDTNIKMNLNMNQSVLNNPSNTINRNQMTVVNDTAKTNENPQLNQQIPSFTYFYNINQNPVYDGNIKKCDKPSSQQRFVNQLSTQSQPAVKIINIKKKKEDEEEEKMNQILKCLKSGPRENAKSNSKPLANQPPSQANNITPTPIITIEKIITKEPEQIKINIPKTNDMKIEVFKKLESPLLPNGYVPTKCKNAIKFPVKYKEPTYFKMIDSLKNAIPTVIKDVKDNRFEKALSLSEDILFYLTNITPND